MISKLISKYDISKCHALSFYSECFLRYCAHKFRSSFGKSRLIRDQENVMLAFSGGQSSSAMVHLVREVGILSFRQIMFDRWLTSLSDDFLPADYGLRQQVRTVISSFLSTA